MKKIYVAHFVIAASFAISASARADTTFKMTVSSSISTIKGKHITARNRQVINDLKTFYGKNTEETVYQSGNRMKAVYTSGGSTEECISASGSNAVTVLLPSTKEMYSTTLPLLHKTDPWTRNVTTTRVKETKATKTILGYKTRLYRIAAKSANMTIAGYMWVAADLSYSGGNPILDNLSNKRTGTPLHASVNLVDRTSGIKITQDYNVTAISTAPVAASTFEIPTGYMKIKAPLIPIVPKTQNVKKTEAHNKRWVPGHFE